MRMADKSRREYDLLHLCLQDLTSGKAQLGPLLSELPPKCEHPALVEQIEALAARNSRQHDRLERTGYELDGPDNIWMKGIVDDARRDVDSEDRGWSRDVALVGALRKAFAAQFVSTETALAIAQQLGEYHAIQALTQNRSEEVAACATLGALLAELTAEDRR